MENNPYQVLIYTDSPQTRYKCMGEFNNSEQAVTLAMMFATGGQQSALIVRDIPPAFAPGCDGKYLVHCHITHDPSQFRGVHVVSPFSMTGELKSLPYNH